jgi:O-phosphoseryl-tRNA synthetase
VGGAGAGEVEEGSINFYIPSRAKLSQEIFEVARWDHREITEKAKKDFEGTWEETAELIPEKTPARFTKDIPRGSPHVIHDTLAKLRDAYLALGFDECINPVFIEATQVEKQFGPEAPAVLDRCYFLAGLPRPDVGLGDDRIMKIRELTGHEVDKAALQETLHAYKKGEFGGDDLVLKMSEALSITDTLATRVLNEVFPEYAALKPEATGMTLRSHMTSGWFMTLASLAGKKPLPLMLFSVDRCFRREQTEDATHLRTHHSASCVIMDADVSVEDGKEVAEGLLRQFGFTDFKFTPDEKRSKYYVPGTQTEVYAYHPATDWVEIATFGIYSPVALSRYKIEDPVMNLGLGVERLAMVMSGTGDIREMAYPQFYGDVDYSDEEIAELIGFKAAPATEAGRELAERIVTTALEYASDASPCEFVVYEGDILGKNISVKVTEREENTRLLGPAAQNGIYVKDGSIIGTNKPKEGMMDTGIKYIDAVAALAAARVEEAVQAGEGSVEVRVPMVKSLSDINLDLDDAALRFIQTNSRKIDVRGPVFTTIEAVIN